LKLVCSGVDKSAEEMGALDRSVYSTIIEEIKTLIKIRKTCVTYVSRSQNTSSYFMANYARTRNHKEVRLSSGSGGFSRDLQYLL
jgi:hypothetical protein